MNNTSLVRISLFAALIAVLGLIPKLDIPLAAGVPVTAQTLGVMLAGLMLGPRNAVLSILLLLFAVALGAPVLSGGRGGLGVFFGPTVGFLAGWVLGAWLCGWIYAGLRHRVGLGSFFSALVACGVGGIFGIYALGIPGLALVTGMPLQVALFTVLIFIPGDVLKCLLAAWLVSRLHRHQHPLSTVSPPSGPSKPGP